MAHATLSKPTAVPARALAVAALGVSALVVRDGRPTWLVVRLALVALAWWVATRTRSAYLRLIAGVVVTTTGGVIAVAYVTHAGLAVAPLVAAATAAAGVVIAGSSLRELIGARRGVRRLGPVLVLVALVQLLVLPLVTAVHATNVPPSRPGDETPATFGLVYENVALVTSDGVDLAAWYVPSRNGAAVVVLHGAGSTKDDVLEHAAVLADAGFGTLLLDARGHGDSGGDAMDLGWFGERDTRAAVDWLSDREDVDSSQIGALGLSMGGEEALTAAARDERIRAVVAEGATGRVADDARWADGSITDPLRSVIDRTTDLLTDVLTSARPPQPLRDAVAAIAPREVLLIAGAPRGELEAAERYRDAASDAVTVWHLADTPHTDGLDRHPDEWRERVTSFLRRELLGS